MNNIIKTIFILSIIGLIVSSCDDPNRKKITKSNKKTEWIVTKEGDSVLRKYRNDGSLLSYTTYVNRIKNGPAKKFYENGKTQFEINYKDGKKNGIVKWYYDNGKLYRESVYVNGKIDGIQKKYYESGKLMAENPYEMGRVLPGLKEYTKSGKLKKIYPKLKIKAIDRLAFENKYIIRLSLSPKAKKPKFFQVMRLPDEKYTYLKDLTLKNGTGELVYTVYKGGYVMEKVTFRVETKTSLGNMYVIEKKYNVAIDN